MTNEQLAILLEGIYSELDVAIAETEEILRSVLNPPPEKHRVHVASFDRCPRMFGPCDNPEHYVENESPAPIVELIRIGRVRDALMDRIRLLVPTPDES